MPERADATGSGSSPLCLDQDTLNAYAQKKLDPERCSEAEAHLAHCADCFAAASDAARRMGATAEASTERDPALGALEGAAPVRLASGAIVGRYRVVGLVGEGGMGSVYEAYDPQLDRAVALKLVRADKLAEPTARARLAREARTMAKLSHDLAGGERALV